MLIPNWTTPSIFLCWKDEEMSFLVLMIGLPFLWLSKARISMPSMNVNIWAISQSQSGPLLFLTLIVVLDWGLQETSFPFKPQAQLWENVQISFSFIWDKRTTAKYLIFTTVTPKLLNQLSVDIEKLFLSSSLLERL